MPSDANVSWVLLPRATHKVVPWRNGQGSTREIAIDPPHATVADAFRWRVSSAPITADGPFSQFAGMHRTLWLLSGEGVELAIEGVPKRLTQPLDRVDFAGESMVHAKLLHGPIVDLNVMVHRATCRAESTTIDNGQRDICGPCTALFVAITKTVIWRPDIAQDQPCTLSPGDALRVDILADTSIQVALRGIAVCAEFRAREA
jgi:uncharacterized protein